MSTNRRETVTIVDLQGRLDRVTLPAPEWEDPESGKALYAAQTGRRFDRGVWISTGTGNSPTWYRELTRAQYERRLAECQARKTKP